MEKAKRSEAVDLPDHASRPGVLLRKAHQVAVAIFAEEAGHLSLTPPQHNILSAISRSPGCSQSELSRAVGYDRATVGAVLAGLEARELVKRDSSATDRRLKELTITRQGRQLLKAAAPATQRINDRILEILPPHERELFVRLLTKIAFSHPADG
jgi:DNA-binding MarR family transcriptional regulator